VKQVTQSLSNGNIEIVDLPIPEIDKNQLLIKTTCSLISGGTERMLINFGQSNILQKAKQHPDKLKDVLNKMVVDGPLTTLDAVSNKLEEPIPLGYSNVGEIIAKGDNVSEYKVGDRVVNNGPHAEYVVVNKNLCAKIPEEVIYDEAVFTIPASIGLQGIRLAEPTLGETFIIVGLGLIGLLTAQLLKANGCNVYGLDIDNEKIKIAKSLGIESFSSSNSQDSINWCKKISSNVGVDGVLITAATNSNNPIDIASQVCRKRGRIILIGTSGLKINREYFYKKELTFKVSCSYGPGRYDQSYEEEGLDYPLAFVRWTEKRNFEAVLSILKNKKVDFKSLITNRFKLSQAEKAYTYLYENSNYIGILFDYNDLPLSKSKTIQINKNSNEKFNSASVSVIGAGNYSKRIIMPHLSQSKASLQTITSRNGFDSTFLAKKYNFKESTTNTEKIWSDLDTNTVFILTRHNSHAEFIIKGLKYGKNVFVEKPICTTERELASISKAFKETRRKDGSGPILMVGFNRRFSKFSKLLKKELNNIKSPKSFIYTCNAGFLDKDHWTNNYKIGGGRLIGEACHFLDLIMYLADSRIADLNILCTKDDKKCPDTFSLNVKFNNGSIGNINYFSNGNKNYQKEKLDVFAGGRIYQIRNFLKLKTWGSSTLKTIRNFKQDKGQKDCINEFINAVKSSSESPISFEDIYEVQKWLLYANKKVGIYS
tara:strand:- start:199 stop:2331 length:2133 start_codon:yes stop_codon:yes gene_type:complete